MCIRDRAEEIEIAALSPINCDTARVAAIDTIAWNATPVYLNSIWRSGTYINLHLRVIYTETARLFNLTVDSATKMCIRDSARSDRDPNRFPARRQSHSIRHVHRD